MQANVPDVTVLQSPGRVAAVDLVPCSGISRTGCLGPFGAPVSVLTWSLAWSRRGLWAPRQPSCLSPLLFPGAGGTHGCLCFIGVLPGPLRGRDSRRGPSSSPKMQGGLCREYGPSSSGVRVGNTSYLGGSLQTRSPFLSPFAKAGQLWSLGDSERIGA